MTTPKKPAPTLQIVKGKIPLRRVPSDDFHEVVDGVQYHPHADEWIEMRPGALTLETMAGVGDLAIFGMTLEGMDDGDAEAAERLRPAIQAASEAIARVVHRWNWTDNDGAPLGDRPTAETIQRLSMAEVMYLANAVRGGVPGENADDLKA